MRHSGSTAARSSCRSDASNGMDSNGTTGWIGISGDRIALSSGFVMKHFGIMVVIGSLAVAGRAEPLRLSLAEAVQRALHEGSRAQLARSAEERARIARAEALENLLPQAEAHLTRYNQSINLQTFGFSLPGQPPVIGPFNVTDAQIAAAMQL